MQLGRFDYHVSPDQRRGEIAVNEAIIAQLDACAALVPFYEQAWALGWSDFEPEMLAFVSLEACAALGLAEDVIASVLDAISPDAEVPEWAPPSAGRKQGQAALAAVRAKFGTSSAHPAAWPQMRSAAMRRAATARRALRT